MFGLEAVVKSAGNTVAVEGATQAGNDVGESDGLFRLQRPDDGFEFLPQQISNVAAHAAVKAICASEKTAAKLSMIDGSLPLLMSDSLKDGALDVRTDGAMKRRALSRPDGALPGDGLSPSDLACILYTSGTSGNSKGVMLTHGNIVANAIATRAVFPLRTDDRVLSVMPLAHTLERDRKSVV
mgnify:CR=1 FL=1